MQRDDRPVYENDTSGTQIVSDFTQNVPGAVINHRVFSWRAL
jgi:hypothetical protein